MARVRQSAARKGAVARTRRSRKGAGGRDETTSIEAVDRAARILLALAASPQQTSLVEVANRTRLSKPTAFRILATLVAEGLAVQNAQTASYSLGVVPLQLGSAVLRDMPIRDLARPVMQAMRDKLNETVVLSVREGDFRFNVDSVEAMNAIGQTQQIGVPIPLYAGAASRVLLASLGDDEIDAYLARTRLVPYSDTTVIDREKIVQSLRQIRADGVAHSLAEFTPGGHAVAAPILGPDGRAIAALHVSIPGSRASNALVAQAIEQLHKGVEAIGRSLRDAAA